MVITPEPPACLLRVLIDIFGSDFICDGLMILVEAFE